jgi:hypothetical protein
MVMHVDQPAKTKSVVTVARIVPSPAILIVIHHASGMKAVNIIRPAILTTTMNLALGVVSYVRILALIATSLVVGIGLVVKENGLHPVVPDKRLCFARLVEVVKIQIHNAVKCCVLTMLQENIVAMRMGVVAPTIWPAGIIVPRAD